MLNFERGLFEGPRFLFKVPWEKTLLCISLP